MPSSQPIPALPPGFARCNTPRVNGAITIIRLSSLTPVLNARHRAYTRRNPAILPHSALLFARPLTPSSPVPPHRACAVPPPSIVRGPTALHCAARFTTSRPPAPRPPPTPRLPHPLSCHAPPLPNYSVARPPCTVRPSMDTSPSSTRYLPTAQTSTPWTTMCSLLPPLPTTFICIPLLHSSCCSSCTTTKPPRPLPCGTVCTGGRHSPPHFPTHPPAHPSTLYKSHDDRPPPWRPAQPSHLLATTHAPMDYSPHTRARSCHNPPQFTSLRRRAGRHSAALRGIKQADGCGRAPSGEGRQRQSRGLCAPSATTVLLPQYPALLPICALFFALFRSREASHRST